MSRLPRLALAALIAVSMTTWIAPTAQAGSDDSAVTRTKKVGRTFGLAGTQVSVDERTVSVTVNHTANLRGRERVQISWKGAHPSGGRASNPFGEKGMAQEYPVVILQCRGRDDSSLPVAKQISPKTCWTSTSQQRFRSTSERQALWRRDPYAAEADRAQKSGLDPFPTQGCDDIPSDSAHAVPFVAANGKVYLSCSADTTAPEAAVDAALPAAEQAAFTDADGTGSTSFEVRTATENESLGCSDTVACSIVVIPIEGMSCSEGDAICQRSGRFAPGSSNFAAEGVDDAVSPTYWWAASNWRNRITIPVTFGTAPNVCDILDSRAPTAFYGSELMSQAALQWSPAYCLRKDRFKFQLNRMSDTAAFALMEKGTAPAAMVSSQRKQETANPIAYAPTAVTGFAVSYVIDKPENAGEYRNLRLTPRLLAKLMTQSYTGSAYGAQHPGMGANPQSINADPEFQALNPGLDDTTREAAATLLSLSDASDVISSLTSYIASDAEAMAFVDGKKDPWGMVVNPSYRKIDLPVAEWPLKDTFVPTSNLDCKLVSPYFSLLAAPVTSMRTIAEAVLDGWPNVQTLCDKSSDGTWKFGRAERQNVGSRFMLGVVSLGDAERFGLNAAALRTSKTTWVRPTAASMATAISTARRAGKGPQAFTLKQSALTKKPAAYPGTMIVHTVARTSGLEKADAAHVAQFIRVATSEGQKVGSANGTLPGGYLPITNSGVTKPLYAAAQSAAALIAAQKGPVTPTTTATPSAGSGGGSPDVLAPEAGGAPEEVAQAAGPKSQTATAVKTAPTAATTSSASRLAVPLLLLVALSAGVVAPVLRRAARMRSSR